MYRRGEGVPYGGKKVRPVELTTSKQNLGPSACKAGFSFSGRVGVGGGSSRAKTDPRKLVFPKKRRGKKAPCLIPLRLGSHLLGERVSVLELLSVSGPEKREPGIAEGWKIAGEFFRGGGGPGHVYLKAYQRPCGSRGAFFWQNRRLAKSVFPEDNP